MNGVLHVLRGVGVYLWAILSGATYSIPCVFVAPFSGTVARRIGRAWARHLLRLGFVKVQVDGLERIDPTAKYVFMANHGSALDIPSLMVGLPQLVVFMAKKELFRIPFFGWGMAATGHLPVDRGSARKARESIVRAAQRIHRDDISLVLFPEGTRSSTGEIGDFKSGSLGLAVRAGVPIVPTLIHNANRVLPKKVLFVRPGTIRIVLGDPIPVTGAGDTDKRELVDKVRGAIVEMQRLVPEEA